mgnify:CR=1 FL=1
MLAAGVSAMGRRSFFVGVRRGGVAGLGVLALTGCPDIGYVYTDPDPSYPYPEEDSHEPVTSATYPTSGSWTTEPDPTTTSGSWTTEPGTSLSDFTTGDGSLSDSAPTTGGASTGGDTETDGDTGTSDFPEVCGNGVVEGSEQCDDGNQDAGDGCEADCTNTPVCGNGAVEVGEVCDDGNNIDGDECSADCLVATPPPVCGNGEVEGDELCDDGNNTDGDGCEADCTLLQVCGDGVVEPPEECDDGNDADDDECHIDCTLPVVCGAPAGYIVCDAGLDLADKSDPSVLHRALGICNDQADNSVLAANFTLGSNGGAGWQVARGFGSFKFDDDADPNTPDRLFYAPREGDALVVLSTGAIAAPNPEGAVVEAANSQVANGDDGNDDGDALPAPFAHEVGSNAGAGGTPFLGCDGVHDCSDTLAADWQALPNPDDAVWFSLHAGVPAGVTGYTFDMAFCSSEWPASLGKPENDVVIAWQSDPSLDGYTGNVAHLPSPNDPDAARPLTLSTLHPHFLGPGFVFNEPQLGGTGFEQHACSSWLRVRGGVSPGVDVQFGFYLADRGDSERASVVLLDNFRWECVGCEPALVDECGVAPAP